MRFRIFLVVLAVAGAMSTTPALAQTPPPSPTTTAPNGDLPVPALDVSVERGLGVQAWFFYGLLTVPATYEIERSIAPGHWELRESVTVADPTEFGVTYRHAEALRLGPAPHCFRARAVVEEVAGSWSKACLPPSDLEHAVPPAPVLSATYTRQAFEYIGVYAGMRASWPALVPPGEFSGYEFWVKSAHNHWTNETGEDTYRHFMTVFPNGTPIEALIYNTPEGLFGSCVKLRAVHDATIGPFSEPVCLVDGVLRYESGGLVPSADTGATPAGLTPTPRAPATGEGFASAPSPVGGAAVVTLGTVGILAGALGLRLGRPRTDVRH